MKDKDMDTNDLIAMRTKAEYCMTTANETTERIRAVARAICKSISYEGVSCCQWPAQRGRTDCPVDRGGYDDAAIDVLTVVPHALLAADAASPASGGEWSDEQITAGAIWLAENVIWTTWNGLRPDGRASDSGFKAWPPNMRNYRQEDFRDAVRAMLAALSASPAPAVTEEWQPIETAPKDSAWVWTFTPSRIPQQAVMRWMPGATLKQSKWETSDRQWYVFGPTHWRPLPAPPTMIRGEHK